MKKRRIFFTAIFSIALVYFAASNFFVIKPFKDLAYEDIKEVSVNKINISEKFSYSDEKIVKKMLGALKSIRIYKKVDEPVLDETNVPIMINLNLVEKRISIIDASPYLSIDNVWYLANDSSFRGLNKFYKEYLYVY